MFYSSSEQILSVYMRNYTYLYINFYFPIYNFSYSFLLHSFQLQASQATIAVDRRYKGMVDCFIRVPREQGFLSFWRGNWSNILRASAQVSSLCTSTLNGVLGISWYGL